MTRPGPLLLGTLVFIAGCSGAPSPTRLDITGMSTTLVRYRAAGELVEIHGLRFRHLWVEGPTAPTSRTTDLRRNDVRHTLAEPELARVIDWVEEHRVLTLTSPDGRQDLPTIGDLPANTLEVQVGESRLGIGWDEDSVWRNQTTEARLRSAVAALRSLANEFDGVPRSSGRSSR